MPNRLMLPVRLMVRIGGGMACLLLALLFCAWLFVPQTDIPPGSPVPEGAGAIGVAEPGGPVRTQVEVDYASQAEAAWRPRGEPPVLEPLVRAGQLPEVAERVGDEPLVLRGVEGTGRYGGTMYRLNGFAGTRLQPVQLVRFGPRGLPVVPNAAKSWSVGEDGRVYTFRLRKGMKWSDGHPFTSADILYWWEHEQCDRKLNPQGPWPCYTHQGRPMQVSAPDPLTIRFRFDSPNYLFLEQLASFPGHAMMASPRHFLLRYHPTLGEAETVRQVMQQHNLIDEKATYLFVQNRVEKPSLAPWISRTEKMTSPETLVRNPYFWAVDEQGRQLPYIDRIVSTQKSADMLVISAAQGEVSMQARYLRNQDYTLLMQQREQYGYRVHHLVNGDGADWGLAFNMNRRITEGVREEEHKARLLADKRFRQALSLAVNRQAIIQALFAGLSEPLAVGPSASSPFYLPDLRQVYGRYDPAEADRLLDRCGLTERDADGYRRLPGGPSLLFDINYCAFSGEGPGQFVVEDWAAVGIRARLRNQDRTIFYVEKSAGLHDMTVWGGYGEYYPLLDPRYYFPVSGESNFAVRNAAWYESGGLYDIGGNPRGTPPAEGHSFLEAMRLYEQIKQAPDLPERQRLFGRILELASDNVYLLNIYSPLPQLAVVKNGLHNVPSDAVYSWVFQSPANMAPETWYFDPPQAGPGDLEEIRREISQVRPLRPLLNGEGTAETAVSVDGDSAIGVSLRGFFRFGIGLAALLLVVLLVLRFPFVLQRVLIMIPTLLIISLISFAVIELPPGDAIHSRIILTQDAGGSVDQQEIDLLKQLFRTEEPFWKRYAWWIGLDWFSSFDRKDEGLLQGNMGRSMIDLKPVNDKVGDRLLFTFLISFGTILFTWAIALPIGIYSAVRQYSLFDYLFTVVGFVGMCIPGFLLALLLMFAAEAWFGVQATGLFSPEYAVQTEWTVGKVLDLLRHLWLPILVQGVTGTAGMIRVMRANLLDELKKPYVTTARAKGVRPLKLLFKYPVRIALNPFISGIGSIFPQLISGGAIVAIVMSLPTIGPMQLEAVMQQDMYLAGSMLMTLSLLSVIGMLCSDILLVVLDPRIRAGGEAR